MNRLDPIKLFGRIASDVPRELHEHLFVTGSLAAAYHFRKKLEGRGINTKDADLVVHPAGHTASCQDIANRLLSLGWKNTDDCFAQKSPTPIDNLRAIRLYPPASNEYFVEFLNIPEQNQTQPKEWIPLKMSDGWYGLPSFRFMGVVSIDRCRSQVGLEYANPAMMALANLLSHPQVGETRIQSGEMTGILRSAKDLGRVIALARLEGRDAAEQWHERWLFALQQCFPADWRELGRSLGSGLEDLIEDPAAMEDAQKTTDIGLLNQMSVSVDMLKATAQQLLQDVIVPLRNESARAS
ncbi:MAG: hypothetical protein U0903_10020 [Planctomycetales bacterium]